MAASRQASGGHGSRPARFRADTQVAALRGEVLAAMEREARAPAGGPNAMRR